MFPLFANKASDSHLPQLRQLLEDPRRLEHSKLIVVQAPGTHNAEVVRHNREVSSPPSTYFHRRTESEDSQLGSVLRDVVGYFRQLLVGTVHRGALAAALLRAGQVGEAVAP